jgi:hypothetical protein
LGLIVLAPPLHNIEQLTSHTNEEGKLLAWKGATFAHLNRIATADVCIIVNPGGYLGTSSTLELGYAIALRKLIIAFQHDKEWAREGLFDIILETEDEEIAAQRIAELLSERETRGWTNVRVSR